MAKKKPRGKAVARITGRPKKKRKPGTARTERVIRRSPWGHPMGYESRPRLGGRGGGFSDSDFGGTVFERMIR